MAAAANGSSPTTSSSGAEARTNDRKNHATAIALPASRRRRHAPAGLLQRVGDLVHVGAVGEEAAAAVPGGRGFERDFYPRAPKPEAVAGPNANARDGVLHRRLGRHLDRLDPTHRARAAQRHVVGALGQAVDGGGGEADHPPVDVGQRPGRRGRDLDRPLRQLLGLDLGLLPQRQHQRRLEIGIRQLLGAPQRDPAAGGDPLRDHAVEPR